MPWWYGYEHTKDVCPFFKYCVTEFEKMNRRKWQIDWGRQCRSRRDYTHKPSHLDLSLFSELAFNTIWFRVYKSRSIRLTTVLPLASTHRHTPNCLKAENHNNFNPFWTIGISDKVWHSQARMVHCIYWGVAGYNFQQIVYFFLWSLILSYQTVQILMKCCIMWHFIWVYTVCQSTRFGVSGLQKVKHLVMTLE